jgi:HK97 family phage prohead protease
MWHIPPIGNTLDMETREVDGKRGLWGRAKLFLGEHAEADKCYAGLREGALKQFSFAYDVIEASYEERDGIEIRLLKKVEVFEWGPTLVGANRETELITVKSNLIVPTAEGKPEAKSEEPTEVKDEELEARTKRFRELLLEYPSH